MTVIKQNDILSHLSNLRFYQYSANIFYHGLEYEMKFKEQKRSFNIRKVIYLALTLRNKSINLHEKPNFVPHNRLRPRSAYTLH